MQHARAKLEMTLSASTTRGSRGPKIAPAVRRMLPVMLLCIVSAIDAACEPCSAAEDLTKMLDVAGLPTEPSQIDWRSLPKIESERSVVFRGVQTEAAFNLHSYLGHHDGKFWAMWSCGKVDEDRAGQHVRYATSPDGLDWSESQVLATPPEDNLRCIARGFWPRNGELLALYSIDEAGKYFGEHLRLMASRWNEANNEWEPGELVFHDAINNFPPRKLPNGNWMMSRRNARMEKSMLLGGVDGIDRWQVAAVPEPSDGGRLEEPFWWVLPDNRVVALFRDNARSRRLYRAISADSGETWTTPVRTNFPDATSKFNAVKLHDGRYVMVSNPNPAGRIPLCLAISDDGLVFRGLAVLLGEPTQPRYKGHAKSAGYQYPHLLDNGRNLYVIYAQNKEDIVVLRLPYAELDRVALPSRSGR
jgi:predicted neuraminidase